MGSTGDQVAERRSRGQFYTPPEVARFLIELLTTLAPGVRAVRPHSVIDPACGLGVFLQAARSVLDPPPGRMVGVDLYPQSGGIWERPEDTVEQRIADGLLEPTGEQFDLVLGNPPFHSDGLHCLRSLGGGGSPDEVGRARRLLDALTQRFQLWREVIPWRPPTATPQMSLPGTPPATALARPPARALEQLARYPAELVFLERFVELCRPGGHVVIVLPEGVTANRRLQYVRDWLSRECNLLAVVGLPRGTFRRSGTAAATATLLLQRKPADGTSTRLPALLLDVERLDRLDGLLGEVREAVDRRTV